MCERNGRGCGDRVVETWACRAPINFCPLAEWLISSRYNRLYLSLCQFYGHSYFLYFFCVGACGRVVVVAYRFSKKRVSVRVCNS